jgi:hypothetical protein
MLHKILFLGGFKPVFQMVRLVWFFCQWIVQPGGAAEQTQRQQCKQRKAQRGKQLFSHVVVLAF